MRYRTVIFDCDSTLSSIEGIEELAREHRAEIARLTTLAMEGKVPLEEVYGRRLELIHPGRAELERVGTLYIQHLVPGAMEAVQRLRAAGVTLRILSGGLAPAVRVVGRHLGFSDGEVTAVEVNFSPSGAYAGYDHRSPLARSGGKRQWIEANAGLLPPPVLLVGDGATDLEARPAIAAFAAFTGVVRRPDVVAGADLELAGPSLTEVLEVVLHDR